MTIIGYIGNTKLFVTITFSDNILDVHEFNPVTFWFEIMKSNAFI